jgi:hypothetical protein
MCLFHGPGACLSLKTPIGKLVFKGRGDLHFVYHLLNDCIENKDQQ